MKCGFKEGISWMINIEAQSLINRYLFSIFHVLVLNFQELMNKLLFFEIIYANIIEALNLRGKVD